MKGDRAKVTCLIKHPMETGNRKGDEGQPVPIHYVKYVRFSINGELVSTANLGPGVSVDPLLSIDILGAKPGDTVSVEWLDNKDEGDKAETKVK